MTNFVPETCIRCAKCHSTFYKYIHIKYIIDLDADDFSKSVLNGEINKIVCPHCHTEFIYETPLILQSYTMKTIIYAGCEFYPITARNFKLASEISKSENWNFRCTEFTMDACEKMRIFRCGLNDGTIELIKLTQFPEYKTMDLSFEYITFESVTPEEIVFAKRDEVDKITDTYNIPFSVYEEINKNTPAISGGQWNKIDRQWAIKALEDMK